MPITTGATSFPACHLVKHIGRAQVIGQGDRAFRHLAKVNGWSMEDTKLYVEVAYEEWSRRSTVDWTLDISWLDEFFLDLRPD